MTSSKQKLSTVIRKGSGGPPMSQDVPIFLQKAYQMIDTCDPKICCWSEDGLTFIVKNPNLFETTIIPNFYKHNKFTSFVRQLNFYGFRKVKYSDSLRINHKEEKTTKKYWRFKHPNFQRGRQDLLIDIKRQPSVPNGVGGRPPHGSNQYTSHRTASNNTAQQSNTTATTSKKTISYSTHQTNQDVHTLKNEMSELKSRVVNMSCNIDLLTDMVQKVTVHDFDGAAAIGAGVVSLGDDQLGVVNNKRKKMGNITNMSSYHYQGCQDDDDIIMPDWNPSSSCMSGGIDPFTLITDGNDDDDTLLASATADPLPDLAPSSSSAPLPDLAMSTADVMAPSSPMSAAAADVAPSSSDSNGGGDDNFVDDLFQAFADEESLDDAGLLQEEAAAAPSSGTPTSTPSAGNKKNNVCPKLMKRIEDSLSTIPSEMHELVAKKLIDAISDTKPIVEGASSLFSQGQVQGGVATVGGGRSGGISQGRRSRSNSGSSESSFKKTTDRSVSVDESSAASSSSSTTQPSIPLPIAVSALKTILAEYGVKVECKMDGKATATSRRGSSCSKDADPRFKKSSLLPVVPMHA